MRELPYAFLWVLRNFPFIYIKINGNIEWNFDNNLGETSVKMCDSHSLRKFTKSVCVASFG